MSYVWVWLTHTQKDAAAKILWNLVDFLVIEASR